MFARQFRDILQFRPKWPRIQVRLHHCNANGKKINREKGDWRKYGPSSQSVSGDGAVPLVSVSAGLFFDLM